MIINKNFELCFSGLFLHSSQINYQCDYYNTAHATVDTEISERGERKQIYICKQHTGVVILVRTQASLRCTGSSRVFAFNIQNFCNSNRGIN